MIKSFFSSFSPRRRGFARLLVFTLLIGLELGVAFSAAPALAQVQETLSGPPDLSPLAPHVVLPDALNYPEFGTIPWPLDCSAWPENPPDGGYLASIFGHRIHGGGTDFHRGSDYRCDPQGDTCCLQPLDGDIVCDQEQCAPGEVEVEGAPIRAILGGVVHRAKSGSNNNLVVKTTLAMDDLQIGTTFCDRIYVWYSHMRSDYAINPATGAQWAKDDVVPQGAILGWQGKFGANSVHLHVSTRACTNSRADGDPVGTLDPEINPFQLIGNDDGGAPPILSLDAAWDGADLVVTVRIATASPDFDQMEISVYDAPADLRHVRRLGYNNRYGIDVAGDNLDTSNLEPNGLSVLTTIREPDPPDPTSGLTLEARFVNLNLATDPNSRIQVKVADVFGNTTIRQIPAF